VASNRSEGLEEAVARANLYLEAGADLAFVTGVVAIPEVKTLVAGIHGAVSIAAGLPNNINSLSIAELKACGVARVSLPVIVIYSAIRAINRMLVALEDCGDFSVILQEKMLCSPEEIAVLKR
jgi:2-methylisocitrate lyase-like PEP mutase family enzyme